MTRVFLHGRTVQKESRQKQRRVKKGITTKTKDSQKGIKTKTKHSQKGMKTMAVFGTAATHRLGRLLAGTGGL